ncbi:MAG: hypothetical protein FWB75_08635, partial [Oscillospiraceae bacterium]|nr:hypothetical protein [Oscillospiraceae bacterium]
MSKSDRQKYIIIAACVLIFAAAIVVSAILISSSLRLAGQPEDISAEGVVEAVPYEPKPETQAP